MAKSQQYDADGLTEIFRQYGDHLYSKGEHKGAIERYIKTIGKLEPSYVIRKVSIISVLFKLNLYFVKRTLILRICYIPLKKTVYKHCLKHYKYMHLVSCFKGRKHLY